MIRFIVLLAIIVACSNHSNAANCKIAVKRDITDTFTPDSGSCNGQSVTVTLNNEYRAYCTEDDGHCESTHYAYHKGSRQTNYRTCFPIPKDSSYNLVKHENVPITCGDTETTIDLYYINATNCECGVLIDGYEIDMGI